MAIHNIGINALAHEDFDVRMRLEEHSLSKCPNGCKYYIDPKTNDLYLIHLSSYGCRVTE